MAEKFTRWDAADYLKTEEDMVLYLDACMDEDAGDGRLIRAGLNDIARARGVSRLAHDTGITREGIYRALSAKGNPELATVLKIIKALGMKLHVVPSAASKPRRAGRKKALAERAVA